MFTNRDRLAALLQFDAARLVLLDERQCEWRQISRSVECSPSPRSGDLGPPTTRPPGISQSAAGNRSHLTQFLEFSSCSRQTGAIRASIRVWWIQTRRPYSRFKFVIAPWTWGRAATVRSDGSTT